MVKNKGKVIKRIAAVIAVIAAVFLVGAAVSVYVYPPQGVLIFEYHRVNDDTAGRDAYSLSREEFQEQLDYFKANGYHTISLMDFVRAQKYDEPLLENPIILTFDDGYEDNYTNMMPMVKEMGMKATMFTATNFIGKKDYVSWQQLKQMQDDGIEIGSHTANHLPLEDMDEQALNNEIKLSKLMMEWNGMKTIYFFSYPNGIYSDAAVKSLRENDYLAAVTGDAGYNTPATDKYLLQRVNVSNYRWGMTGFKLRIFKAKLLTRLGWNQHLEE